ncbi:DNA replication/repair protein RecF [Dellaglioa sp. BT-FLS60]
MYLENLTLRDYRNYEDLNVSFSPAINILLGENAQGKTNLLEAIYVLSMTRSHRTNNDKELIKWDKTAAIIQGRVSKQVGSIPLEIQINSKGKKAKVNHLEQAKLSQYIGQFNVILFAPEDLALVKGAPAVRRRFIDMEFGQINARYLYNLGQYRTILKQRNQYLKQLQHKKDQDLVFLDVLSDQLAAFGAEIVHQRLIFLKQLEFWANQLQEEITQSAETVTFEYATHLENAAEQTVEQLYEQLQNNLKKATKKEIFQGTTLAGPHRDDVRFLINGKNVQTYGSQGQQRTTALSVKLAEIELMKEETGEYPVLLLDDVLSELDDMRQTHLLKTIQNKVQTFLTTPNLSGIARTLINEPKIFHINQGNLLEEEEHTVD